MNTIMQKELELIQYVRTCILQLTEGLSVAQMNLVPDKMKNNLIWNIGHLVFTQQMLCYKLGGLTPTIDMEYFAQFAPDTIPQRIYDEEDIHIIKKAFLLAFEQLSSDVKSEKLNNYTAWILPTGIAINSIEDAMATNAIHEGRHFGVAISLVKLVA